MPKRRLITYPGAIYHIIQRGNNRSFIFMHSEDKRKLIELISEAMGKHGFKLLAYVVMNNHYHLTCQMWGDSPSIFMKTINWHYSRYYNQKYNRTGPLFDGRFRHYHVYDRAYLLTLIRYIHQNPLRAGLCNTTLKYHWSSHRNYARNTQSNIVDIDVVLEIMSNHRPTALKLYEQQMQIPSQLETLKQMHDSQSEDAVPGIE